MPVPGTSVAEQLPGVRNRPHITGTPEEVARVLTEYQRAGLEYVICAFEPTRQEDLLRQMRIFSEEIAPQFAEAA